MCNNSNVTSSSGESPIRTFNGTQAFHYLRTCKVRPAVPTISIMRGTGSVTRNWTTYKNHYTIQAFSNSELQNHLVYCNDVRLISATCDAFSVPLRARSHTKRRTHPVPIRASNTTTGARRDEWLCTEDWCRPTWVYFTTLSSHGQMAQLGQGGIRTYELPTKNQAQSWSWNLWPNRAPQKPLSPEL
jgi:hypothetical protein